MNKTESLLQASENIRQALLNNDPAALVNLISDDYCGIDPNGGEQDRDMMLEAYGPDGVQLETFETSDVTTRVLGDVGLVMGVGVINGSYEEHRFEHNLRFLDVYVHQDSVWRLCVSQVTEIKTEE